MLISLARRCRDIFAVPTIVQQLYGSTFVSIRGSIAVSAKVQDFLQARPAGRGFRYLDVNRTVIREIFLKHGVFTVQSPRDIPNSACEAVEELLNHAEQADEYKDLYREAARELATIRQALNIPNDEIGIVGGVDLILETIENLKRHQRTVA